MDSLRPYQRILKYTKEKHDENRKKINERSEEYQKSRKILELKSRINPFLTEEYFDQAEKISIDDEQKLCQTKKKINKRIENLLKKKDTIPTGEIIKRT